MVDPAPNPYAEALRAYRNGGRWIGVKRDTLERIVDAAVLPRDHPPVPEEIAILDLLLHMDDGDTAGTPSFMARWNWKSRYAVDKLRERIGHKRADDSAKISATDQQRISNESAMNQQDFSSGSAMKVGNQNGIGESSATDQQRISNESAMNQQDFSSGSAAPDNISHARDRLQTKTTEEEYPPNPPRGDDSKRRRRSRTKELAAAITALVIPPELDVPEFRTVWDQWVEHRSGLNPPKDWMKLFQKQLDDLATYGLEEAIYATSRSVTNEYRGLFPRKRKVSDARAGPGYGLISFDEIQRRTDADRGYMRGCEIYRLQDGTMWGRERGTGPAIPEELIKEKHQ